MKQNQKFEQSRRWPGPSTDNPDPPHDTVSPSVLNDHNRGAHFFKTPMNPKYLLGLLALFSIAATPNVRFVRTQPVSTVWNAYSLWEVPSGSAESTNGDMATMAVPVPNNSVECVSFLTTTTDPSLLGDLTGKTISATISITSVGTPMFVYNFEGYSWNTCPAPASVRIYFTTTTGMYDLDDANANETQYWWADIACAKLSGRLNTTLTAELSDPTQWSDSQGNSAADPQYTEAFLEAVKNVGQIGLAFGGGCFYDTGVGQAKGSGRSVFHLKNYTVN
jgi:hypothetical protein